MSDQLNLKASDLRRYVHREKQSGEWIAAAYFELEDHRLIMAIKCHKQKSMAVQLAMRAARERVAAGDFQAVQK